MDDLEVPQFSETSISMPWICSYPSLVALPFENQVVRAVIKACPGVLGASLWHNDLPQVRASGFHPLGIISRSWWLHWMVQWKMGPPKWKETNINIADTPIFHCTMIMGGRVSITIWEERLISGNNWVIEQKLIMIFPDGNISLSFPQQLKNRFPSGKLKWQFSKFPLFNRKYIFSFSGSIFQAAMLVYHRRSTYCTNRRIPRCPRHRRDGHPLPWGTHRLRVGLDGRSSHLRWSGARSVHVTWTDKQIEQALIGRGGWMPGDGWMLRAWQFCVWNCCFLWFWSFLLNVAVALYSQRRIFEASDFADLAGFPSSGGTICSQATSVGRQGILTVLTRCPNGAPP